MNGWTKNLSLSEVTDSSDNYDHPISMKDLLDSIHDIPFLSPTLY